MAYIVLRVLLVLTLLLNGASAPWAMVSMNQGLHEGHGSHRHAAPVDAVAQTQTHAGHADHHGSMPSSDIGTEPESSMDGDCCGSSTCQCGCALPVGVNFTAPPMRSQLLITAPQVTAQPLAVVYRGNPPFRPPAV